MHLILAAHQNIQACGEWPLADSTCPGERGSQSGRLLHLLSGKQGRGQHSYAHEAFCQDWKSWCLNA